MYTDVVFILGNVLTTVSDQKLFDPNGAADNSQGHYVAQAVTISDYYPFGHEIADRSMSTNFGGEKHRYGFNDKEQDSDGEWGSSTTAYDYGFRIYNPGIARFLSVDPLASSYPFYTPYQFAGNKPIAAIDLDGLEEFIATDGSVIGMGPISQETMLSNNLKPTPEWEYAYSEGRLGVNGNLNLQNSANVRYAGRQAEIGPNPHNTYDPFATSFARQIVTSGPAVAEEVAELPMLVAYAIKGVTTGDYTDVKYQAAGLFIAGISGRVIKSLDPSNIRFTQPTASQNFSDGDTINDPPLSEVFPPLSVVPSQRCS